MRQLYNAARKEVNFKLHNELITDIDLLTAVYNIGNRYVVTTYISILVNVIADF